MSPSGTFLLWPHRVLGLLEASRFSAGSNPFWKVLYPQQLAYSSRIFVYLKKLGILINAVYF